MLIITGSEGNVGRRLRAGLGPSIGVDLRDTADIQVNLATGDFDACGLSAALAEAQAVIHLATAASPFGKVEAHARATVGTARLVAACAQLPVPRLILASSNWAAPTDPTLALTAYSHAKRALEDMAALYDELPDCRGIAIRVGWVPRGPVNLDETPDYLRQTYWPDDILCARFRQALEA